MSLHFHKIAKGGYLPGQSRNGVYLSVDNWDDFGFKSLFYLTVFDADGVEHRIGNLKIGYLGQGEGRTEERIPYVFENLSDAFFSLGQDAEYYKNIVNNLSPYLADQLLVGLRDLARNEDLLDAVKEESVFRTSLLRDVSLSVIHGQFKRVLAGGAPLTEYHFSYKKPQSETYSGIDLDYHIEPNTRPSTNIHILIGRNGAGKTTLLNNMVNSIIGANENTDVEGGFYDVSGLFQSSPIPENYFSSVVSVSFSAFDPFIPPQDRPDRSQGSCFYYIGLKKRTMEDGVLSTELKSNDELCTDFVSSLKACLRLEAKKERWINAIEKIESDINFSEMELGRLADISDLEEFNGVARSLFTHMSSGHAVVLLSITKLVETVEEKTLVLLDEPESHLHPPLLSAFTRAVSDLLVDRNGVAIIATHSPVVLQEVPKTCVWKLRRSRLVANVDRPENETFGENVGVLTREVFGLEVSKSGYHDLLADSVSQGGTYEEILESYKNQLGYEGRAVLRALMASRDVHEADH